MRVLFSTALALVVGAFIVTQTAYAQQAGDKQPAAAAKAAIRPTEFAGKSGQELNDLLQPVVDRAAKGCKVINARIIGGATGADLYEVVCESGVGAFVNVTVPRTATTAVSLTPCLTLQTENAQLKCTLSTPEGNTATFKDLATKAEKPCAVTNQRFVGATGDGSHYFEYACPDGTGFMLKADLTGAYKSQTSCLQATTLAGGCTLTDAKGQIAALTTTLTNAAKAGGVDCAVTKFGDFPEREDSQFKATELGCSNRPESVVLVRSDAKTAVLNCIRARAEGWSCANRAQQEPLAYPALTNELAHATGVQKNYTSCTVNGASGSYSLRSVYVEVTCSDGTPGFMIQYPLGDPKPQEIYTCGQAVAIGGGCKMAANKLQ